jgi:hypothetical protein
MGVNDCRQLDYGIPHFLKVESTSRDLSETRVISRESLPGFLKANMPTSGQEVLTFQYSMSGGDESWTNSCLLYTSPSPRDRTRSRMPSSA